MTVTHEFFYVIGLGLMVVYCLGLVVGLRFRKPSPEWKNTYLTGIMSIFHEGELAATRGATLDDVPYISGTAEARAWCFGFLWWTKFNIGRDGI